jgi:hypothetical protein
MKVVGFRNTDSGGTGVSSPLSSVVRLTLRPSCQLTGVIKSNCTHNLVVNQCNGDVSTALEKGFFQAKAPTEKEAWQGFVVVMILSVVKSKGVILAKPRIRKPPPTQMKSPISVAPTP